MGIVALIDKAGRLFQEGDIRTARRLTMEALADSPTDDEVLNLMCKISKYDRAEANPLVAQGSLMLVAHLADKTTNHELRGDFHNGLGITYENRGERGEPAYFDKAFIEYDAAIESFRLAGNFTKLHSAQNNIVFLKLQMGSTDEAFERLTEAREYFERAGEYAIAAQVDDTFAQAYLALNKLDKAFESSSKSILALQSPGESLALGKSLETIARIIEKMKND